MRTDPVPLPPVVLRVAASVRLDDPVAAWTGTGHNLAQTQPVGAEVPELTWVEMLLLEGDGAYEGLSAMLVRIRYGTAPDVPTWEGYIFGSDLPQIPDRVPPIDEQVHRAASAAPGSGVARQRCYPRPNPLFMAIPDQHSGARWTPARESSVAGGDETRPQIWPPGSRRATGEPGPRM